MENVIQGLFYTIKVKTDFYYTSQIFIKQLQNNFLIIRFCNVKNIQFNKYLHYKALYQMPWSTTANDQFYHSSAMRLTVGDTPALC